MATSNQVNIQMFHSNLLSFIKKKQPHPHLIMQAPPTNRQNRPRPTLHQNNKPVIDPDLLHSGVTLCSVTLTAVSPSAVYRTVCELCDREVKWKTSTRHLWDCGLGWWAAGLSGTCNGPHLFTWGQKALTADQMINMASLSFISSRGSDPQ